MRMTGLKTFIAAAGLALAGLGAAHAAPAATPAAPTVSEAAANTAAATTADTAPGNTLAQIDGAPVMAPQPNVGQPTDRAIGLQPQVTPNGRRAHWMHDVVLVPTITIISIFVLILLAVTMIKFRRVEHRQPSKTTHNTFIEVVWTLVPVIILVLIAVPSIGLLSAQFKPAPANAITLKAIGNQWYWTYQYPDNGGFEITSNMLKEKDQVAAGDRFRTDADGPRLMATDNRIVLPVGVPIRLVTTSNDVIHSWAVPAFWIKLDAVPGRLNETSFTIEKPGVYFGQCSELCGARHAFMPIAVEAVPPAQFAAWVASKGGKMGNAPDGANGKAAPAATPAGNPADAGNTAMPASLGPVENATVAPATTSQPATANNGAGGTPGK